MNIIICMNSLGNKGGIESVTIEKANEYVRKGHRVTICFSDRGTYPITIRPLSKEVNVVDLQTPFWVIGDYSLPKMLCFMPRQFYCLARKLQRVIDEEKPDVVISTGQYSKFAFPLLHSPKGKRMLKIREFHFASNYHKLEPGNWVHDVLFSIMSFVDRFVLSRFFDKNYLLTYKDKEENFAKNNRYDVMHNPIALPILSEEELTNPREKVVLMAVRLTWEKDVPTMLRMWHSIPNKHGWRFRIIGDGSERKHIERVCEELNDDSIQLVGWSDNPSKEMREASIMTMTSKFEGFGVSIVEGMANGLPIVSFDFSYGPSDIISDGEDGYLIPNRDERLFAEKLEYLMRHDDVRLGMGKAALRKAKQFSVDKITGQWLDKFNELLAKK